MRRKKILQTTGVTLLGALALLLAGALLLTGVWALLPDRTGETRSYDSPYAPSEAEEAPELYPWNLMTKPWDEGDISLDEDELFLLLEPFLMPYAIPSGLPASAYIESWEGGEFLYNEDLQLAGFRDITIRLRSDTLSEEWEKAVDEQEAFILTSSVLEYRFSFAMRERDGETEICFVSLEPLPPKDVSAAEEEAGLDTLTSLLQERYLLMQKETPFSVFLWQFVNYCDVFDCDYSAALQLYQEGSFEVVLADHTAYFTFTDREGVMTLLCDPVYQTVYGISLQRYGT